MNLQKPRELPFESGRSSGAALEGVARLRGAFSIDLALIRPDPAQPRREFPADELAELAASVLERGVRQPIRVWFVEAERVYQIVSGERRYRAAIAAGLTAIPCVVDDPPPGALAPERRDLLIDQVVENWQRQDLNPYDLSDALKELRDKHGLSQDDIARRTGKPKSEISRYLAMQKVEPGTQAAIRSDDSGRYSRRHVVAIAKLPPSDQQAMATKILEKGLTAVQTEREVTRRLERRAGRDTREAAITAKEYAVGSARVKITFRKRGVMKQEVLDVLDRVRGMVEREAEGGLTTL